MDFKLRFYHTYYNIIGRIEESFHHRFHTGLPKKEDRKHGVEYTCSCSDIFIYLENGKRIEHIIKRGLDDSLF